MCRALSQACAVPLRQGSEPAFQPTHVTMLCATCMSCSRPRCCSCWRSGAGVAWAKPPTEHVYSCHIDQWATLLAPPHAHRISLAYIVLPHTEGRCILQADLVDSPLCVFHACVIYNLGLL
jgi:hypothetical protein